MAADHGDRDRDFPDAIRIGSARTPLLLVRIPRVADIGIDGGRRWVGKTTNLLPPPH
jgi:hypothetical protein